MAPKNNNSEVASNKNNNIEVAPLYFQCHISFATRWCQPHGLLGMDSYIKDIIQAPIIYGKCKKKCRRNEITRPKGWEKNGGVIGCIHVLINAPRFSQPPLQVPLR